MFVSPQRQILLYLFSLSELCSNNVAEYQALIIGLQMAIEMGILQLEIFGDSKLVINQILEQYDVKKEDLIPYCKYAKKLLATFEAITLEHIPRKENRQADVLANLDDVPTSANLHLLRSELFADGFKIEDSLFVRRCT